MTKIPLYMHQVHVLNAIPESHPQDIRGNKATQSNTLRIQAVIYAPTACPPDYIPTTHTSVRYISEPLHRLCKQDVMQTWDSYQIETFQCIKTAISTLLVFTYFNPDKECSIE